MADDPQDDHPDAPDVPDGASSSDATYKQTLQRAVQTYRQLILAQQQAQTQLSAYTQMTANPLRGVSSSFLGNPAVPSKHLGREGVTESLIAAANLRFLCASYPDLFQMLLSDFAFDCFIIGCPRTTHITHAVEYAVLTSATAMREIYPRDKFLFGRYYMDNLIPRPVGVEPPVVQPWLLPALDNAMPTQREIYDLTERITQSGIPSPSPAVNDARSDAERTAEHEAARTTGDAASARDERLVLYPLCLSHMPIVPQRSSEAIRHAQQLHVGLRCQHPCERASYSY